MSGDSKDLISAVEVCEDVHIKSETSNIGNSKVCSVCGDVALGYNFNALTCESCKAFFRRNALKVKEFKCPFTESCIMTAITRRFCQRCRLQKCFSVGMRKESIMSEEERLFKRTKIEQNRARKRAVVQNVEGLITGESKQRRSTVKKPRVSGEWNAPPSDWSSGTTAENLGSPNSIHLQGSSPLQSSESLSERLLEPFPSPTTATSATCVPSPNSPPDSATVAASHNTEMIEKRDESIINKQSMISVITYPHQINVPSLMHERPPVETDDGSVSSTSISTQTSASLYSDLNLYKTVSTQTPLEVHQYTSTQSTPLLTSLINSHRSEDLLSTQQEASTSPLFTTDSLVVEGGTGGWTGVDGVNSSTMTWQSCAPFTGLPERDSNDDILQDVLRMPVVPNSIESILSEAIKLEFSTYTPSSIPTSHLHSQVISHSRELNDAERAKLNELIVANKALLAPIEETSMDQSLLDIINLTAVAIRRLVKMAKKINAFKNMCQEDQVALLKGACMEMLILHSATTYNPDKDSWAIPHSTKSRSIKVDVLKEARGNLYHEHRRFQQTFDPSWRTDENIMLILSAIALFTPDRPRIVHRDVIKLEQNSYYYLLRRYLECTFPGCEARSIFLKLIQKVSELHRLNEEHVRAYLDVDPCEVEPLLIEIFDLKPPSIT